MSERQDMPEDVVVMPSSGTLSLVLDEAGGIAARAGVPYSSAHLVMALLSIDSEACAMLTDRGVTPEKIARYVARRGDELTEPADILAQIRSKSVRIAQSCGSAQVDVLHLIIVLSSLSSSVAHTAIAATGVDPRSLRSVALAVLIGGRRDSRPGVRQAEDLGPLSPGGPEEFPDHSMTADAERSLGIENPREPAGCNDVDRVPAIVGQPRPERPDEQVARLSAITRRRERARNDPRVTRGRDEVADGSPGDPPAEAPDRAARPIALDPKLFPTLTSLGRNLTDEAQKGRLEALVGRRQVVEQVLDILGKRRANNPCLVGEPGVGKTAIAEGLAYLQVHEPEAVPYLRDRVLVELNMGSLLSGTQLRGSFSERMAALRDEVERARGHVIVFLDEIHTLVGAGAVGESSLDAVGELSAAMARGVFPCIGATSTDQFKRHIEESPALHRRLQRVLVSEPTKDEALSILQGIAPSYAAHHQVTILPEALESAVRLSGRYISDRFLPDKAIATLDLSGSRARRKGKDTVGSAEVAEIVAESSGIPVDRLLMSDADRFLAMESFVCERIVGHREILRRVCQVVRRNYAGFSSNRPIGSFLFLGPTGVGKTETARVLADFLFQSRDAMFRLDMSEYMEPHSVARLIGSPPGYVGHDEGGQLTEAIRRHPYQILLMDEVEKAHRDVLQVLLQLLDDGRLTDGRGRTVDFSNTVVLLTSNLGSEHYDQKRGQLGFGMNVSADDGSVDSKQWERIASEVLKTARKEFPIELWNRIEQREVFEPLTRAQILEVARLLVQDSSKRIHSEKGISFEATPDALEYLVGHGGYDPILGARPMRTTIQRLVEGPIAEQILLRKVTSGNCLRVDVLNDELVVELQRDSAPPGAS